MNLSLHIKLDIIEYITRTGVNKSSSTKFWHGLHHHLTRIEGAPLTYDHKQLRLFFYNSLLPDILRNKLPITAEKVQHLCYPFLLRLYNFRVIVTERGTSAELTQEKLKLHKLFVRYLLSDKAFNQEIWNEIRTIGTSLDAKTFYVDLNNPQIQLERAEKNKLRKRRAPQDRAITKKKRSCLTDGWSCSKKANDSPGNLSSGKQSKPCDQADSITINLQPLQDGEKCCKNDLPDCISSEPLVLISSIEQAKTTSPTMFSQNLPQLATQELTSNKNRILEHPKANESNGSEEEAKLGGHPTSRTITSQAEDAENCSINIESIDQSIVDPSIYSQHSSDQSEKRLDCPELQELTTTPTANDSKGFEDQPELDVHSTITSQPLEDMDNDCENNLTICISSESQDHASTIIGTIEQEKPNSPLIFSHIVPQREPQELTRTNRPEANDSNGSEDQPEKPSASPDLQEITRIKIETVDQSKVNYPSVYSEHLSDQSENRLNFSEPQQLTSKADDPNRSEDQPELCDHPSSTTISSKPVQDTENCYSPMPIIPDSSEVVVNNTAVSADLFDECCSDDLTIANVNRSKDLPFRSNPDALELTSANNEANDSPTVCSQKSSNRSEDQPKPVDHSYSIVTRSRSFQAAVNSCKNDSPICGSLKRQELDELTKPTDCIEISEDSSDDCTIQPENTRTVNDLVCISSEPNKVISTKNQPIARSRRVQVAVNSKTDLRRRARSGPKVPIGTNDNTMDSVDISDDSCSEECTMQHVNTVKELAMNSTNCKPKKRVTINNNTIDLTEISDDSNCSVDLPIPYSMYDFCDDNDE